MRGCWMNFKVQNFYLNVFWTSNEWWMHWFLLFKCEDSLLHITMNRIHLSLGLLEWKSKLKLVSGLVMRNFHFFLALYTLKDQWHNWQINRQPKLVTALVLVLVQKLNCSELLNTEGNLNVVSLQTINNLWRIRFNMLWHKKYNRCQQTLNDHF